jgi:hypothetical protein
MMKRRAPADPSVEGEAGQGDAFAAPNAQLIQLFL